MKNHHHGFLMKIFTVIIALLIIAAAISINKVKEIDPTENLSSSKIEFVTVTSPNGGELWQEGKTYTIRWTTKNVSGTQNIRLVNGNNEVIRTIAANIPTSLDGSIEYKYDWTISDEFVSEASPQNYKILVSFDPDLILDYSDGFFTIFSSGKGI